MTIIDKLDLEIQLLERKDRTILRGKAAGETNRYNKIIILDWFSEEKPVNLVIAAIPQGEPEGLPGRLSLPNTLSTADNFPLSSVSEYRDIPVRVRFVTSCAS